LHNSKRVSRGMAKGAVVAIGFFFAVLVAAVVTSFTYRNSELELRNRVEAKQQECEVIFDQVWKTISQQAQITQEYKDGFREVFLGMTEARYDGDSNSLMKFVGEANPNFDPKLYDRLMNTVEEQRAIFSREQKALISLARQHKTMLEKFPGSLFLAGRSPVEISLVTSTRTKNTFQTGKDDDVKVFK
jgi:hypothetical protein